MAIGVNDRKRLNGKLTLILYHILYVIQKENSSSR